MLYLAFDAQETSREEEEKEERRLNTRTAGVTKYATFGTLCFAL